MLDFTNRIERVDLYDFYKFLGASSFLDVDTTCTATVKWSAEIETRDWGIKSILANVHSVTLDIAWSLAIDATDANFAEKEALIAAGGTEVKPGCWEGTKTITSSEYKQQNKADEWGIENNLELDGDDELRPQWVEVHFEDKTIYIS